MHKEGTSEEVWHREDSEKFWRQISPPDHVVQIYENEKQLLDSLVAFAVCGFNDDESVVVIGTSNHIEELDNKLRGAGYDLFNLRLTNQYITVDATQTLYEFTINGMPDPILLQLVVSNLMKRTKRRGQKVRIFGELVAILWAQGNADGILRLEQLWRDQLRTESFSRFCAYPKSGFVEGSELAVAEICKSHTHVVTPSVDQAAITYREVRTTASQKTASAEPTGLL